MATYNTEKVRLDAPAQRVFDRLSNLEGLREMLDRIPAEQVPEDKRKMLDGIKITPDTITIPAGAGPIGAITLRKERQESPSLISFKGEGLPVPLGLDINIEPDGADASLVGAVVSIDVPAMFKPMINGPMNQLTKQFGSVLGSLHFD